MSALKPTKEQVKIINHLRGNCIVEAGPGCAKTSTLALRVKHMLNNGHSPKSMALVTHSKALAADIQHTLVEWVGQRKAEQITVCTIHSFAYQLVEANYHLLGMDQHPTLIQAEDKKQFIHDEAQRLDMTVKALSQAYAAPNKISAKERALRKSYQKYLKFKSKSNTVDYDDMLTNAAELLALAPKDLSLPYKHLMVDELQDINRQQKQLLLLLATRMQSTVLVGDPLQLIYGWRQASLRYWQDIEQKLKGLKRYALTRSFRVPLQALPFINNIGSKIDEDAPLLRSKVEGEAPELVDLLGRDTGLWLAKEVKALLAEGVDPNQIAILAKTRKELSQIALALRARNIPITERYHQPDHDHHKKHLLALIQLARLEQLRSNRPTKKLTSKEREQLSAYLNDLWLPGNLVRSLQKRARLKPEALLSVESGDKYYEEVNNMVNAIRTAANLPRVESAVQCLIDVCKPTLKKRAYNNHKLYLRDLVDLKLNMKVCADLNEVCSHDWITEADEVDGVQLMTVFSAKGQEWDYVFLLNVVDGVYPRPQKTESKQLEEQRVFYVGITRHHQKLYLLQSVYATQTLNNGSMKSVTLDQPSPFIDLKNQSLVYNKKR